MYRDVVHRTQIYLDNEEAALLAEASASTGASRSELIRRAVRGQYGATSPTGRLEALRASAGSWTARPGTGADYVDGIRADVPSRRSVRTC